MNTRNIGILVALSSVLLFAACSNDPTIKSATEELVIIDSPTDRFIDAFELAKKECAKNNRFAEYLPNESRELEEVAFNCIGEEVVAEAGSDTDVENVVETADDAEIDAEPVEETLPLEAEDNVDQ